MTIVESLQKTREQSVLNPVTLVLVPMFNLIAGAILGYLFGRKKSN